MRSAPSLIFDPHAFYPDDEGPKFYPDDSCVISQTP